MNTRLRYLTVLLFLFTGSLSAKEMTIERFCKKYHLPAYQDIIIQNKVISEGTNLCAPRFELIRPVLELYDKDFKVLDLGAAQGYFSFRTAREYPHSFCVMVDANTKSYAHGNMLYDLCLLNSDLKNICYLNRELTIEDLAYLNQQDHFDVILGLLVVHLMYDDLRDQAQVIDSLLSLGDNVILEVANEIAVPLTRYVESLSTQVECQYLGEVERYHHPESHPKGKLFWFKSGRAVSHNRQKTDEKVLQYLNKAYPANS